MAILVEVIYRSNVIPIKVPMTFFTKPEKTILNFLWKCRRLFCQNCFGNNVGGITISDFKFYYRTTKTA
jgi:hypothetical protein